MTTIREFGPAVICIKIEKQIQQIKSSLSLLGRLWEWQAMKVTQYILHTAQMQIGQQCQQGREPE